MYLSSTSTQLDHDVWLIDSSASFHMKFHIESLCEYERYEGVDVLFVDETTTKFFGLGRV